MNINIDALREDDIELQDHFTDQSLVDMGYHFSLGDRELTCGGFNYTCSAYSVHCVDYFLFPRNIL